jgi:hypothetical protein
MIRTMTALTALLWSAAAYAQTSSQDVGSMFYVESPELQEHFNNTFIILLIVAAVLLPFEWLIEISQRDGEWHPHDYKMRRWVDGKWQYREMTDAEEGEDVATRSW